MQCVLGSDWPLGMPVKCGDTIRLDEISKKKKKITMEWSNGYENDLNAQQKRWLALLSHYVLRLST
jgi:hypothetical protein